MILLTRTEANRGNPMNDTLFGHLASRFQTHPENLATEGLCYVLRRSDTARDAFVEQARIAAPGIPTELRFKTQAAGGDGAIPDMVGEDSDGRTPLLVEAKFWAGLTDNQPVKYLDRLPADSEGVLVFVAPSARFETLWRELWKRCCDANLPFEEKDVAPDGIRVAEIGETRKIALTSWRFVLKAISTMLERGDERGVLSDVHQLEGLCDQMDTDAFLPLRGEELSPMNGRRVAQFCELADSVTEELASLKLVSTKGLKAVGTRGRYGRYIRIHGHGAYIYFTSYGWGWNVNTPLWLKLWGADWTKAWSDGLALVEHLRPLELSEPPKLVVQENLLAVPLHLKLGAERQDVVADLVEQVREVVELLPPRKE
jgi:hypothetical protein